MRDLVRHGLYVMTTHADDKQMRMISQCLMSKAPYKIVERQKEAETGEWKYVISGNAVDGRQMVVVAKFGASVQMLYILTVYAE